MQSGLPLWHRFHRLVEKKAVEAGRGLRLLHGRGEKAGSAEIGSVEVLVWLDRPLRLWRTTVASWHRGLVFSPWQLKMGCKGCCRIDLIG